MDSLEKLVFSDVDFHSIWRVLGRVFHGGSAVL
jgi:hypothetical protein